MDESKPRLLADHKEISEIERRYYFGNEGITTFQKDGVLKHGFTLKAARVLELICEGKTNAEIAEAMNLSHHTIRSHYNPIFYGTFAAKNRVELVNRVREAQHGRNHHEMHRHHSVPRSDLGHLFPGQLLEGGTKSGRKAN